MTLYFLVKYLHALGAIVILGTGSGIAFFMLMAHRTDNAEFIARTASVVVIADAIFTLAAVNAIGRHPATVQDKWFARLFLIKALVVASLVVFWLVSGFIALFVSYRAAAGILSSHHFPPALVDSITIGTSLMDMTTGVLIAFRRTAAIGLFGGIVASLGYMFGAAILMPDLWIEPLGALVKTGPAIVLMLVALLMLDNR